MSRDTHLRARISRKLLDLAGRPDIPVYAGCADRLDGGEGFVWFGIEGEGILDDAPAVEIPAEPSIDALERLFAAHEGLELVAVGPMTNVAAALGEHPRLAGRISRITIMGGHVRRVAYGDHVFAPGVDYNLCSDAEASVRVLSAGLPTRLVTADVTLRVWLTQSDLERIEARGTPFHDALGRALRRWTPVMREVFGSLGAQLDSDNVAFLHDPLALASVYDQSFCTFEDLEIEPAIVDGVFRTLERDVKTARTWRMSCATGVDAERFRRHFCERLLGFEPPRFTRPLRSGR